MEDDLVRARKGEIPFPAEKYVNRVPVKKHDHVLIPAGTIRCSGKNTMVLEISATPYIFTFKLWDWGRVGLDGLPRPIHLKHGLENIQWDRDTDWIYSHCVHQEKTLHREEGVLEERTGLDIREPIETVRYSLERPVTVKTDDSVTVCNLVEGRSVKIQSTAGTFPPFTVHYAETCIISVCVGEFRICPNDGPVKLIAAQIRR